MARQSAGEPTEWKDKYFSALEEQEKRDRAQQQLTGLLMRAVMRISLVADGVDESVDQQLAGLRHILRDGNPSRGELNTVVDALEGQVKRLDMVKDERAKAVVHAFTRMVRQLEQLGPERDQKQQLGKLRKSVKQRAGRIQEYPSLINEYARVQQAILQDGDALRISKPFWHRWVDAGETQAPQNPVAEALSSGPVAGTVVAPEVAQESLDLSRQKLEAAAPEAPAAAPEDPPFSRLNSAVCDILGELLDQIECPPLARDNYQSARNQITRGLNWYELVPVLEDISLIVIAAFDNNQKDFESFLSQLNQRLEEAYACIDASRSAHNEGVDATRELRDSMQQQVTAMQQSVAEARELDQLKREVSQRLDRIVAAMDQHAGGESLREASLAEQLDALVARVKHMETASSEAEQRIEEQRQKALRDVLTQLPNREAYQQRLQQEFERWERYRRPLTLAVCDVDHFKRVNDTYGHLAGDKVLRIVAKTLKKRLRKTDFIARYGGEEFVILMPETTEDAALNVLDGVREAIGSCPFHFKDNPVQITMSFGVTAFSQDDDTDAAFERADKALYRAKQAGRNRCMAVAAND